jgi:acetyl-CoA carboxylase biotin carboxylase subunit
MFNKILIANRGEIASRIIRTSRRMGIQSVAVYSEADQYAPYVKMADESYLIGKSRVSESYLNVEKILEVAKLANVEAIHPGYGLLSEHPHFAEACQDAGIVFIGPPSSVIAKMGSKIEARKEMERAGVPVVPGTTKAVGTIEEAALFAKEVGYPVMLKASAGGGGIGMEAVYDEKGLNKAFESNSKRALAFFGDGTMFIEKKIENPRHIEIQILADHYGHVVHLFERECSIQRRHQKVIEEAPSPFLSEKARTRMGNAAVQAAKSIHYQNAGTIEFLVDEEENFYFLEMNTRLQVEHPITEEITGIDIVEQQLHIANGEKLKLEQSDLTYEGHAIEARVYAEDPVNFYPSPGQISQLVTPEGMNIRNEMAVEGQSMVTPYYDPMIAKLIVKGETRDEAISIMSDALSQYKIEGIKTNVSMLKEIIKHEQFKLGNTLTSFIDTYYIP